MAIKRLFQYVKPGGWVLFDVYHKKWFKPFMVKYWLRPVTRRIPHGRFMALAEKYVPPLLWFKSRVINRILPANRWGQNIGAQLVPIADFSEVAELKSWEDRVAWSVLDTVDMYTPRFDIPLSWGEIMQALHEVGAQDIQGDWSTFCFRARAPGT